MPGEPGLLLATEISRQNVAKEGWTTYYVSKDGNDGANGLKWESAFLTIQRAIDVAESWAKIYVRAGTYTENVVISKQGIHLIGEKRNTVIIHPDAGYCLDIYGESCTIETLKCFNPRAGAYGIIVSGVGELAKFVNIELDGIAGSYGILLWTDFIEICDCYMSNANMKIGIDMGAGFCKCYNNYIKLTRGDSTGIVLSEDSTTIYSNRVFENTIEGCHRGIEALGISKYASIYHNNLINNTIQIEDFGTENHFFENFYDNHTVDTNNDGLCDTPYTFTGGVDYSPVSKRNGWNQISIGFAEGGGGDYQGDIEIWDSFEYVSDAALQTNWIEGGNAGNPTRSLTAYEGQYSMQTVITAAGTGFIYRLLSSRNMKTLANIGIASQSDVGGDTFQFTLYDSAGNYSYWTQTCNAAPDTWTYHNINPHSVPTGVGPAAIGVDLEDVVEIRMANLTASSTYKFDFIKFESLTASKIGIGYDGLDDAVEESSSVRGHLLYIHDKIEAHEIENESVWVATAPAPITANAEYPILEVLVSGGVIYVYRYNFASGDVPAVPTETLGRTEITHFDGDVFELSKLFVNINKVTTGLFPKMAAADKAFIYAKYYDTTASAFVLVPDIVIRNKAVDTLITAPPIQTDLGEAIVFDGAKLQLASRFIIYFYNDANIASEVRIPFTFGVRRAR